MTEGDPADPGPAAGRASDRGRAPAGRGRAGILAVVGSAVAGAALAAAAAALTWTTDDRTGALTGPVQQTGADLVPELVPVALVALAGVGATFATRGWPRRVVGILVAAGGLLIAVRSVAALFGAAGAAGTVRPLGPLLAALAGLLIVTAGALVAAGVGGRRLGARYDAPTAPISSAIPTADARRAGADPSDVDLWRALDAGADPTDRPDRRPDRRQRHDPRRPLGRRPRRRCRARPRCRARSRRGRGPRRRCAGRRVRFAPRRPLR